MSSPKAREKGTGDKTPSASPIPDNSTSTGGNKNNPQAEPSTDASTSHRCSPADTSTSTPGQPTSVDSPVHKSPPPVSEAFLVMVSNLCNPPANCYISGGDYVRLTMTWAATVIGHRNLEYDDKIRRPILRSDSDVHRRGFEYGIPTDVYSWLIGEAKERVIVLNAMTFEKLEE